jgi:hypothetical protein
VQISVLAALPKVSLLHPNEILGVVREKML